MSGVFFFFVQHMFTLHTEGIKLCFDKGPLCAKM